MSDVVTITDNDESVLVVTDEQIVVVLEPALGEQVILSVGEQGPPGAQGENGIDGKDAHEAEMIEDPLAYYILSKN